MKTLYTTFFLFLFVTVAETTRATETENLDIQLLPASELTIDGKVDDWDLSGGVLVCSDVENLREKMGTWIHVAYDDENLYVLSRWLDETPMGNRGIYPSSYGWRGDSLQMRIIVGDPVNGQKMICWATAWRDRNGLSVIDLDFPKKNHENLQNAVENGAQQAFQANADGKGYIQEIALPWKLLTPEPFTPRVGESIKFSVEPNFNAPGRITMKGIFASGRTPDRVFTFLSDASWGNAIFRDNGEVTPQKLRLSDYREFDVTMEDGVPTIDWTKLFEEKKSEGFAKIGFDMPEDGFVSLNIKNSDGQVVRQLLTADFMAEGGHEMLWDGLTNTSHRKPGDVLPSGDYTWEAIYHKGLGLRLVGWAGTASDSPFGSRGGDHGKPSAVESNGRNIYLGWDGSEAGRAIVCTDVNGRDKWSHKRGGFGGAKHIAATDDIVYINDGTVIYRLTAEGGGYSNWEGSISADLDMEAVILGLDVSGDRLYVSMEDGVHILNAGSGEGLNRIAVPEPGDLEVAPDGKVYVLSGRDKLLRLTENGTETALEGLGHAEGLAIDTEGNFYVGLVDPDNQVVVFNAGGEETGRIGKTGGRPLTGVWEEEGMRFVHALTVDSRGRLWVAEADYSPKRFSCWNTEDGSFIEEFFGPTPYGALGGAISPLDPLVMVGSGCEWKIDEETGRATVTGAFHRGRMETAQFGLSPDGREYLAVGEGWFTAGKPPVSIYERTGPGEYALRTRISVLNVEPRPEGARGYRVNGSGVRVWADANGDQKEQPEEVRGYDIELGGWITAWSMSMTQSMIFYSQLYRIAPTGWTASGAPEYDLSSLEPVAGPDDVLKRNHSHGIGSEDGRLRLYNGHYGRDHSDFQCWNIETGELMWTYPNNYVGVHGGHKAPPKQTGMIRGAYDVIGTGKLPDPVGDIFVVSTDKGEWHVLTGDGYYLSSLFQSNPLKRSRPSNAVPGAILDNSAPGAGTEDFGGSITVTKDDELYLQAGKVSFVNIKVVGLDEVKRLGQGEVVMSDDDVKLATEIRGKLQQAAVGTKQYRVKKAGITFTGDLNQDFAGQQMISFQKTEADKVQFAMSYDDENLYLGYLVNDATPWTNGASDPVQMYAMGDTVDFQIGAVDGGDNPPILGNVRLSIGRTQGRNVAVAYRTDARPEDIAPKTFYSGLVRDGYEMKSVKVLEDARIEVKERSRQTVVEVAIPLDSLGLSIERGLTLRGDVGATFSDQNGDDTILRSYWNNQQTGLVADEVYELQMSPGNWGRIVFD